MSVDVNAIHNISSSVAAMRREEANRGKKVNQAGWVTKEQMRKEAAQMTVGVMIVSAFAAIFVKSFTKLFGKVPGAIMAVLLFVSPIWAVIESEGWQNVTWLTWVPLLVIVSALMLKLFTKLLGRKWGLRIGVSVLCFIGIVVYLGGDRKEKDVIADKPELQSSSEQAMVERPSDSPVKSKAGVAEAAASVATSERADIVHEVKAEMQAKIEEDEAMVTAEQVAIEQYFDETRNKLDSLAAEYCNELRANGFYELVSSVESARGAFDGVKLGTANLTYEQAKATIDGALADCINVMDGICDRAKAKSYLKDLISKIESETKAARRYANSSESAIMAGAALERLGNSVIFKLRQLEATSYQETKERADAEYSVFANQLTIIKDAANR